MVSYLDELFAPENLMPGESGGIPTDPIGPVPLGGRRWGRRFPTNRLPSSRTSRLPGVDAPIGFADALFFAFNPHAFQLIQTIAGMRQAQADREMYQQELERHHAGEDLKTRLAMNEMGATEITPGVEQAEAGLTDVLGAPKAPRMRVGTPAGESYYVPTGAEQQAKTLREYAAKKGLDIQAGIAGKVAEEEALQPYRTTEIDFPTIGKVRVPNQNVATALKAIQDIHSGKIIGIGRSTDDQGNVTLTGINADTKQPISVPLGPIGKTKAESHAGQLTQGQLGQMLQEFEQLKAKAAEMFSKAEALGKSPEEKDVVNAAVNRRTAEDALRQATALALNYANANPNQLEGGVGDADTTGRRWPYLKARAGSATSPRGTTSGGSVPVLKAANVAEAARRKGMSEDEFKRWFTSQGGVIR